jgi:hypothetical protein
LRLAGERVYDSRPSGLSVAFLSATVVIAQPINSGNNAFGETGNSAALRRSRQKCLSIGQRRFLRLRSLSGLLRLATFLTTIR